MSSDERDTVWERSDGSAVRLRMSVTPGDPELGVPAELVLTRGIGAVPERWVLVGSVDREAASHA